MLKSPNLRQLLQNSWQIDSSTILYTSKSKFETTSPKLLTNRFFYYYLCFTVQIWDNCYKTFDKYTLSTILYASKSKFETLLQNSWQTIHSSYIKNHRPRLAESRLRIKQWSRTDTQTGRHTDTRTDRQIIFSEKDSCKNLLSSPGSNEKEEGMIKRLHKIWTPVILLNNWFVTVLFCESMPNFS